MEQTLVETRLDIRKDVIQFVIFSLIYLYLLTL